MSKIKSKKHPVIKNLITMKIFKYTIINVLFFLTFFVSNSQNPFHGTWEWQDGNQIFRVFLFSQNDTTKGHFELVVVNNGAETIIYTSNKPYNSNMTQHWHPVINVGLNNDGVSLDGRILDNSYDYEHPDFDQYDLWDSNLKMKIISTNPTTATWKVNYSGLTPSNAPPINIPTDIIMTKVE